MSAAVHPAQSGADPRIVAIACGNFVIGANSSLMIGLLNEVARDLEVSIPVAGQLIAAMSIATAISAPVLALATSHIARRLLLSTALGMTAFFQLLSAMAPGFAVLMLARILAGMPGAAYTPAAAATAGLLAPGERRSQAIMTVGLGHSAAAIVGVPAGVFLGGLFGWRTAMLVFGVLAIVVAIWLRYVLPARLPQAKLPSGALGAMLRNRGVTSTLAVTLLQGCGQFMLFSYIAPALKDLIGASTGTISLMMGWFGLCGLLGNLLGVRLIVRMGPTRLAFTGLGAIAAAHLLWPLGHFFITAVVASFTLWGLGFFALNSALQVRLVGFAPELGNVSVAFNTALVFAGSAVAAATGGLVIAYLGIQAVSWAGLCILTLAAAALAISSRFDAKPY